MQLHVQGNTAIPGRTTEVLNSAEYIY